MRRNTDYTPIQISKDAADFAESAFGQHYLKRLDEARARYIDDAMRLDLTDNYRAHLMTQAKTVALEIEYFSIARRVQDDPKLLQRLHIAAQERSKAAEETV